VVQPIILIGPMQAGKSTVGQLLAEKLQVKQYSMDRLCWQYYAEIGYDAELADRIWAEKGLLSVFQYWKPFAVHAMERVLALEPSGVIDLGAGDSIHDDPDLLRRVQDLVAPFRNVVLLLPSPDPVESLEIIRERYAARFQDNVEEVILANRYFLHHPANQLLAKHVVYTKGKTPQQTRDAILELVDA